VAHRTIDKNKGSPARARGRFTAPPEDQTAGVDEDLAEHVGEPSDHEPELLAVAQADEAGDEDLRIVDRAVARREPSAVGPEARVPKGLMANPVTRYLAEVYIELRKVTWPDWHDAWNMALVVIGMSLAVAVILGAADIALTRLVTWVISHAATPGAAPTPTPTP
jgi:preprotein translocase SecE subunit